VISVINHIRFVLLFTGLLLAGLVQASPDIKHWKTDDGARVYFVEAMELPMIDISVIFDAGSARDGELAGLSTFTAALLTEGAAGLDSNEIARRFSDVGARFSAGSDKDMTTISLRSLVGDEYLKPALELFNKLIVHPDFPDDDMERKRKAMLTGLQYEEQSPGSIVEREFYKKLYGSHPYAIPGSGTTETVKNISRDNINGFYKNYYVAKNAVIAITGAVTERQAKKISEAVIKGLPAGQKADVLPAVALPEAAVVENIRHPSTQTHVRIGYPGVKRGDDDYFALYVGNHILGGGGLVSRLNDEIREKRGLSYSIYSYFFPLREAGAFTIGLQTKNDQADEAIDVVRTVLQDYIDNGPVIEELALAKRNITGGFPVNISSNSKIAGYISMIGFYDLPLDYLDNFNNNINAVTIEQIKDAFKRRLDPTRMVTVTVGDQVSPEK